MKKKLVISFSGGRTSAYMLWWIYNIWPDKDQYEIMVIFCNTGKEHIGTLDFVKACSENWDIPIVWLEGEPKQSKTGGWWGVKVNVVNYATADRTGKVFEHFISKLGIPGPNAFWCSKQMKRRTLAAYLKQIKWRNAYTAIGIRYDEPSRITYKDGKKRYLYLLHDHTTLTRWDILFWWKTESTFDLQIPTGMGNCDNCPKKGEKALCNNARSAAESFGWWQEMTDKYGHLNPRYTHLKPPFNFYYGNLSPNDLLKMAAEKPPSQIINQTPASDCQENCEAF